MNRYKQLIKNMGLLTIGNFASKLLSFLLVPLYTNVLSTQEYGTFDLVVTTISLLLPILSGNIIEAVLRFPLDKQKDHEYVSNVYTVGLRYTIIGCGILTILLGVNYTFNIFPAISQYGQYMLLVYIVQALNQLLISFARATDHVKEVSIAGVITSAVMIGLNLLFLLYFKWGLVGYFWAIIISNAVADLYYLIKLKTIQYVKLKLSDSRITREMLIYSFPMVFNTVGWWINNASDRYIVTWLCGVSANGIYSVAYKIPSILNVFHSIFMQAWILSAVQEYKSDGNTAFFRTIYNSYGGLMTILCSILIVFTKPIASVLFQKDFYQAWQYTPWLLIAVIFGTLSGVLGGVFSAEKDSKMFAVSTCIGAALNVILNIILIKPMGPLGAAIATAVSSYVVWFFRIRHTKKYINLKLELGRDHIIYGLLVTQSILLLSIENAIVYYIVNGMLFFFMIFLYKKEIYYIWSKVRLVISKHTV